MGLIQALDDALINKIAAGEVVERPAAVVKELVENAIDAGSTRIRIDVEESGTSLIKVVDNGHGMTREDALVAPLRHTTSKISSAEDLFRIATLGFRGEALASIAAVSKMVLRTRVAEEELGTEIQIIGGELTSKEVAITPGTTVEVHDLFSNTPARRKHLKRPRTELRHIIDVVSRYSLAYPEIAFLLLSDGTELVTSPGTGDALSAITAVYGPAIAKELLPVSFESTHLSISGFMSTPTLTRPTTSHQSIFINKRFVSNPVISRAIQDAYHTLMHLQRKPVVIMNVQIDPKHVDVNVHPTKKEVRLAHEQVVYRSVFEAIRATLAGHQLIPEERFEMQDQLSVPKAQSTVAPPISPQSPAIAAFQSGTSIMRDAPSLVVSQKVVSDAGKVRQVAEVDASLQEHLSPVTGGG